MKKHCLKFLATCILLSNFQGFTTTLANEMDRIVIADVEGKGLDETEPVIPETIQDAYTKDAQLPVIAKEPELKKEAKDFSDDSEVIEKRTENTKTYNIGNGNFVTKKYFEPIHKKENGKWVDVNNDLARKKSRSALPTYQNSDGLYSFTFENDRMRIANELDQEVFIQYPDANLKYLKTKENAMYFTSLYDDNIDLQTTLNNTSISQEYIFNSVSDRSEITYDVYTSLTLEKKENAICVKDDTTCAFMINAPSIKDSNDNADLDIKMDFEKKEDHYTIHISFQKAWLQASARSFPVVLSEDIMDEKGLDIDGVYVRSHQPDVTSNYSQWFVGTEIHGLAMNEDVGETRTFIQAEIPDIGNDKVITGASLSLYHEVFGFTANNHVRIDMVDNTDVKAITWSNQPSVIKSLGDTTFTGDGGYVDFEIKDFAVDVYEERCKKEAEGKLEEIKNPLLSLSGIGDEGANIFSSAGGVNRPFITIAYRYDYDFDPDMDIQNFDREFRLYTKDPDGFQAISFDGIAKPETTVSFDLQEKQANDSFVFLKEYTATPSKYFVKPIFEENPIEGAQEYTQEQKGNYTTDYIKAIDFPYLDRFYNFKMSVSDGESTSNINYTDGFTLYEVKKGDTLRSIAAYYGIKVPTIISDNRLNSTRVKEGDILFLRFLTENPKLSPDAYRPPIRVKTGIAKYIDKGPKCYGCYDLDPVNMSNGNFHHSSEDFIVKDFDDLSLLRTFNSTSEKTTSLFGNGWSTNYEQYLSRSGEDTILYYRGDGRISVIKNLQANPKEKLRVSQVGNHIEIYDKVTDETYIFDEYDTLSQIKTKKGNLSTIHYDEYGMITDIDLGSSKITFEYNVMHLVKQINLPHGTNVQYEYDGDHRLIQFRNEAGFIETYTYDDDNQIKAIKDKNGNLLGRNTYDEEGRVVEQIDAMNQKSKVSYTTDSIQVAYPNNSSKTYQHDTYNSITKVTDENGHSKSFTYDDRNNIVTETNENAEVIHYDYDGNDNLTKKQNPDGTYEQYAYDGNSNLLSKRNIDGTKEAFTYDAKGNVLTHEKDKETTIRYEYDSQNRVTKKSDDFVTTYEYQGQNLIKESCSDGLIKNYTYDNRGNVTAKRESTGKFTTFEYNSQNLVIKQTDNQGVEKFGYDALGNVTSYIDKKGVLTTTEYDSLNRPTKVTKGTLIKTMKYDEKGFLKEEKNEQGILTTYGYDAKGNKTSETRHGKTTKYTYDKRDRLIETLYPTGEKETKKFQYDALVEEVNTRGLATTYEYDGWKRLIKTKYANGTNETIEYDGLLVKKHKEVDGTLHTYSYDNHGNVLSEIEQKGSDTITTNKTYDKKNHVLTMKKEGVNTTYTYDVYGNPLSVDENGRVTKNTYDINNQLLSTSNPYQEVTTFTYDESGNQTKITYPNGTYETSTYNALNQLESQRDVVGNVTQFTYNTIGQKVSQRDQNGVVTKFGYDSYGNQTTTTMNDVQIKKDIYDPLGRLLQTQTLLETIQYEYNAHGDILHEKNLTKGLNVDKTYDAYGNVLTEKDNASKNSKYEYDNLQRLVKTTDSYGRVASKEYDTYNRVKKEVSEDGLATTYTYDKFGNVKTQTDAQGVKTTFEYDVYQNKIKEQHPLVSQSFAYDKLNRLITTTDLIYQKSQTTTYDSSGNVKTQSNLLGDTTIYSYDAKNRKIQETAPNGNVTKTEYDDYDNVIKVTNPDGTTRKTTYNVFRQKTQEEDERKFVTSYEYNQKGQLIKVTDKLGGVTRLAYDARNNPTEIRLDNGSLFKQSYDLYDRVIEETDPNGNVKKTKYDALGNVIQVNEPYKTTYQTYDTRGRLEKTTENGRVVSSNTYDNLNQLKTSKDALNQVVSYTYDSYGRQITVDDKGFLTKNEYDAHGNLIKETQNNTKVYSYTYDTLGRQLSKSQGTRRISRQVYDMAGNVIEVEEKGFIKKQTYDKMNRLLEIKEPDKNGTYVTTSKREYDASGNILKESNGVQDSLVYTYDANNNLTSKKDGNGNLTKYEYNKVNALVKLETPKGRLVHYGYDDVGNKTKEYFNDQEISFTYDKANRLIEEKDKAGKETTSYDSFGNVKSFTKKDGTTIQSEYDVLNRLTKQNERSFSYNKQNQQVKATNQEGTLTKEYDLYGNLLKTKDPNDNVVTYTYDTYGNKTSMTYANGDKVSYTYDGKDQLLDVRKAGRIVAKYQYDQRGNVTELIQDNVTTNYSYDNANRTTRYLSKKDGVVISDRQYQFDKNGNVLKEIADGKANTFTYNENDELKTSSKFINNKQVQTTYAYDMYGNRVEKKDDGTYKKSVYNDKNQLKQIDSEKGTTYLHYDDIGNITSIYYEDGFIEKYSYDDFGQLTQIKNNEDKVLTYHYDALGERIDEKLSDTAIYESKSYYTTEEDLDLSELRDQLSDENIEETFEALKRQAKVKADNGNSCTLTTTHYKLANYQKEDQYHEYVLNYAAEYSQVLMKDAEASVYGLSRLETDDTKYIVGWNDTVNQTIQDNEVTNLAYDDYGYSDDIDTGFGYNGEQSDITGLIYLRARYYNPKLGRFIQIDPYKGEDNSLESKNRYTFVYNNPYKYVDQSGNFPIPKINIGTPRVAAGFNAGLTKIIENAKNMMNTAANALTSVISAVVEPTPTTVIEAVGNITNFVDTVKETYLPPPPQPCPPKPLAEKSFHEMSEAERRQWATKRDKYGERIQNRVGKESGFFDGAYGAIKEGVNSTIDAGKMVYQAGKDFISNPVKATGDFFGSVGTFLNGLWETVQTDKFWVQLGAGAVSAVLVSLSPITLGAAGLGAVAVVSFSGSGEVYDYHVTYDENFESMLEAKGYSSAEEYFGSYAVKETLLGYGAYKTVNGLINGIGTGRFFNYKGIKLELDKSGNVKLYRAMSDAEYKSIVSSGKFSVGQGSMETKWMATSRADAQSWLNSMDFGDKPKILEFTVSKSALDNFYFPGNNLDNIGPAFNSDIDYLNSVIKSIK